jgi:hypothetical protein
MLVGDLLPGEVLRKLNVAAHLCLPGDILIGERQMLGGARSAHTTGQREGGSTVKVKIGWLDQEHGTVEVTPEGLVYDGLTPAHVYGIVEHQRAWYDRTGVRHMLSDAELVQSLPYRMQGLSWAVFVDRQGVAQSPSVYDPWGDVWHTE